MCSPPPRTGPANEKSLQSKWDCVVPPETYFVNCLPAKAYSRPNAETSVSCSVPWSFDLPKHAYCWNSLSTPPFPLPPFSLWPSALLPAAQDPQRTELEGFLCPYFGAVKVCTETHIGEDGETVEGTSMYFLVLQDMCSGLDNPCALDVKMGRVTVEPGEREVGQTNGF